MEEPRWVPIGKIVRPHGVRGEIKIYPYGETLAFKGKGDEFQVGLSHTGEPCKLTVVNLKTHGKFWVGQFQELISRDEAQKLVGEEIYLPQDLLPPTSEAEYYHYQLIGLTVDTKAGSTIGILRRIFETGGHDVYVVEGTEGQEVLIPAVEDIICHVDLEADRMVVNLPEGLMDAL
jgi:16S rRNA processing protein RimM